MMPPSGFSKKAIEGLCQFVEGCYEDLQAKIEARGNTPEAVKAVVQEELDDLKNFLSSFTIASS